MSLIDDAQTLLLADAELVALATGGIVTTDDVGRLGLNRTSYPAAFDAKGRIKPTVLLKLRDAVADYEAADDVLQEVSARQVLECWLYQDTGFETIDAMAVRIYAVLHAIQLPGTWAVQWAGEYRIPIRDTDLDANMQRSDYRIKFMRRVPA